MNQELSHPSPKCRIIAEVGVNHNGSEELALELVDAARQAGADTVKFQVFNTDQLVRDGSAKAPYQILRDYTSSSQSEMLRRLELPKDSIGRIAEYVEKQGLAFLATPFDLESLDFLLRDLLQTEIKIASADAVDHRLLVKAGHSSSHIFLSTGMCTMEEVRRALTSISHGQEGHSSSGNESFVEDFQSLRNRVTILHCTSSYPAPIEETNISALKLLQTVFGLPVGYSDHTEGYTASIAAVSLGASVIERHLTLDRSDIGPDHAASLDPRSFAEMVELVREVEVALGDGEKRPMPSELRNRDHLRKGLYARRDLAAGEVWEVTDFDCRRPAGNFSVGDLPELLGVTRTVAYRASEEIHAI